MSAKLDILWSATSNIMFATTTMLKSLPPYLQRQPDPAGQQSDPQQEHSDRAHPIWCLGATVHPAHAPSQPSRDETSGSTDVVKTYTECSICGKDPTTGSSEKCVIDLKCSHRFHTRCINMWARTHRFNEVWMGKVDCPKCRRLTEFHRREGELFVPHTTDDLFQLMEKGVTVTPMSLTEIATDGRINTIREYRAFYYMWSLRPTHAVGEQVPDGAAIWRGITTVSAGALLVCYPDGYIQIVTLSSLHKYGFMCRLYAGGWDPYHGRCRARVDVDAMQGKTPYEVILHAIDNDVCDISQLDFDRIDPKKRLVEKGKIPHVRITYRDGEVHDVSIWCAEWPTWHGIRHVINSWDCDQLERARAVRFFAPSTGLPFRQWATTLPFTICRDSKYVVDYYTAQLALYEQYDLPCYTRVYSRGFSHVPSLDWPTQTL